MALVLGSAAGLDTARLVKLVIVHDLPEALAGDATPYGGLVASGLDAGDAASRWRVLLSEDDLATGRREKLDAERVALDEVLENLGPRLGAEVSGLWT